MDERAPTTSNMVNLLFFVNVHFFSIKTFKSPNKPKPLYLAFKPIGQKDQVEHERKTACILAIVHPLYGLQDKEINLEAKNFFSVFTKEKLPLKLNGDNDLSIHHLFTFVKNRSWSQCQALNGFVLVLTCSQFLWS